MESKLATIDNTFDEFFSKPTYINLFMVFIDYSILMGLPYSEFESYANRIEKDSNSLLDLAPLFFWLPVESSKPFSKKDIIRLSGLPIGVADTARIANKHIDGYSMDILWHNYHDIFHLDKKTSRFARQEKVFENHFNRFDYKSKTSIPENIVAYLEKRLEMNNYVLSHLEGNHQGLEILFSISWETHSNDAWPSVFALEPGEIRYQFLEKAYWIYKIVQDKYQPIAQQSMDIRKFNLWDPIKISEYEAEEESRFYATPEKEKEFKRNFLVLKCLFHEAMKKFFGLEITSELTYRKVGVK